MIRRASRRDGLPVSSSSRGVALAQNYVNPRMFLGDLRPTLVTPG